MVARSVRGSPDGPSTVDASRGGGHQQGLLEPLPWTGSRPGDGPLRLLHGGGEPPGGPATDRG
eukprot:3280234-Alexandrium_andersonii.AAC.1